MIELLVGSRFHLLLGGRITGNGRMTLVQTLGRYFTCMVNSHKAGCMCPFIIRQIRLFDGRRGVLTRRPGWSRIDRSEGGVNAREQAVKCTELAVFHWRDYNHESKRGGENPSSPRAVADRHL
jgi:hypothetical protein